MLTLAGLMRDALSSEADAPLSFAKVRVYQQGEITLFPGEFCYGSNNPAAIHAATTGFSIFSTTKRVGMPETRDIDGKYNEFVIPAGIHVTVMLQWEAELNGVTVSCGPTGATFFPAYGRSYDVSASNNACNLLIREIYEAAPGKVEIAAVQTSYSFACAY